MKIGLREANLHFSKYVDLVRNGEQIVLTERGEPVALIKPVKARSSVVEKKLQVLETRGLLKRNSSGEFRLPRAVRTQGKPLSEFIRADRERQF